MIHAAITFFALAMISVLLGAYRIAGINVEIGKMLSMVFLILALLSFVGSLITGRKKET